MERTHGQALGMRAQNRAQPEHRNLEGAAALQRSRTKIWGDRCDKKAKENGELTAQVRQMNNSRIR